MKLADIKWVPEPDPEWEDAHYSVFVLPNDIEVDISRYKGVYGIHAQHVWQGMGLEPDIIARARLDAIEAQCILFELAAMPSRADEQKAAYLEGKLDDQENEP